MHQRCVTEQIADLHDDEDEEEKVDQGERNRDLDDAEPGPADARSIGQDRLVDFEHQQREPADDPGEEGRERPMRENGGEVDVQSVRNHSIEDRVRRHQQAAEHEHEGEGDQ